MEEGNVKFFLKSIIFQVQVGDLGEGRSSHGCASYISPEVKKPSLYGCSTVVLLVNGYDGIACLFLLYSRETITQGTEATAWRC